mgnify:FL=1
MSLRKRKQSVGNSNIEYDKKDNKISTEKMAMTLGISSKTVKRHIKDIGIVRFIGRGSNGHWEIIDD